MTEDKMVGWHYSMAMDLSKLQELVMDREAWHAAVHGVTKSQARLSDFIFTFTLRTDAGELPPGVSYKKQNCKVVVQIAAWFGRDKSGSRKAVMRRDRGRI